MMNLHSILCKVDANSNKLFVLLEQGPRSNFEIGGGGGGGGAPLVTEYLGGGTTLFFLLTLYNFKSIGGGARAPLPPLLRGPCRTPQFLSVPVSTIDYDNLCEIAVYSTIIVHYLFI